MQNLRVSPGVLPRDRNTNTQFLRVTTDGELEHCTHAGQVLVMFERGHFLYFAGHRGRFAVGDASLGDRIVRVVVPFNDLPQTMREQLDQRVVA